MLRGGSIDHRARSALRMASGESTRRTVVIGPGEDCPSAGQPVGSVKSLKSRSAFRCAASIRSGDACSHGPPQTWSKGDPVQMLRTILVPFDGSSLSEQAMRYAVELARAAGARLALVGLARVDHHPRRGLSDGHRTAPGDDVHGHAEALRRDGLVVDTAFAPGEPPDGLLAEIERRQPDLVVMGTLGRSGLGRWRRDRLTEAVVARGGRPVLLVCAWAPTTAANTPRR